MKKYAFIFLTFRKEICYYQLLRKKCMYRSVVGVFFGPYQRQFFADSKIRMNRIDFSLINYDNYDFSLLRACSSPSDSIQTGMIVSRVGNPNPKSAQFLANFGVRIQNLIADWDS